MNVIIMYHKCINKIKKFIQKIALVANFGAQWKGFKKSRNRVRKQIQLEEKSLGSFKHTVEEGLLHYPV